MKAEGLRRIGDHGGSLNRARALFPHAPEPWIDLSTGISPHSYPLFTVPATAFRRLPEPDRMAELADAAALAYGAPSGGHVTIAPGTQILLPRVAALRGPGTARVLGPTYAEHAIAASLAGHEVEEVTDLAGPAGPTWPSSSTRTTPMAESSRARIGSPSPTRRPPGAVC